MPSPWPRELTYGEKYGPIENIDTKEEATAYLKRCVEHTMLCRPELSKGEAIRLEKSNIGYWTGYLDSTTALRVLDLFETEHPIFGRNFGLDPQKLFDSGRQLGRLLAEGVKIDDAIAEVKRSLEDGQR